MRREATAITPAAFLAAAEEPDVTKDVPPEEAGGQTGQEIRAMFESYMAAFQAQDIDGVMTVFADEQNTVMMGTGPDEIWLGKENIRTAHMAFLANASKEVSEERVLVSRGAHDNMAWVSGIISMKQELEGGSDNFTLNLLMVLDKFSGKWQITALHFSNLTGPRVAV